MAVAAWKYFTHQTEWKAYLQDLVSQNDIALLRSIVLIDNLQTEPERQARESVEDNNVGWTKQDAKEMGDIADKVRKGEQLTEGELAKSRNKMKKYWKQLMFISQKNAKQKEEAKQQKINEESEKVMLYIKKERERQFRDSIRAMEECSENGKACEYGICDECPVTRGLQMRLQLGGTND